MENVSIVYNIFLYSCVGLKAVRLANVFYFTAFIRVVVRKYCHMVDALKAVLAVRNNSLL
jgi:hypothetical protein